MTPASLVVGADGQLGRALVERLEQAGDRVIATSRRGDAGERGRLRLDLADDVSAWEPPDGVKAAYLCAAVTSLERCRREPEATYAVNVEATATVAQALVARGAFVVFPSTNLVFDGTKPHREADDAVNPQTEYGRQKAEAERRLLELGRSTAIVRLTKVVGSVMPLFQGWIHALGRAEAIHPFSDMVLAPIPLSWTVEVLRHVASLRLDGITQASADLDVAYAEVAAHIAERLSADSELVCPVRAAEAGLALEALPAHTTLDTSRLRRETGLEPPDVWTTVDGLLPAWRDA